MRYTLSYIILCLSIALGCVSCVSRKEHEQLRADYDSLALINILYQDEAYETDSLVASIIATFQEISNIEGMINVNTLNPQRPASEQVRIRHHVKMLSERLEESNSAIDLLIKRLDGNKHYSLRMQGIVTQLKTQLLAQQTRAEQVAEESIGKLRSLSNLEERIKTLRSQSQRITAQNESEYQRLRAVEDSLNTVYYAMGTKYDLREMRLLSKQDRVNVDNAELSYLTKQDRRRLREVNMMSKTARLLTIHPQKSYKFSPDDQGALVLEIIDPQAFWQYSQIMIVEVDF